MIHLRKFSKHKRLTPTLVLVTVVLLASWMGYAQGGYLVSEWALAAFYMAALVLIGSVTGAFRGTQSRWSVVALGLFAAYTAWTFASLLWSPNRGDAWIGAGQTLLYFLAFCLAVGLVSLGASRRWVLTASTLGPAIVAALTLPMLASRAQDLFANFRLRGTVGYHNAEAAFLLVPFWVAIYLAGSRRTNPILRGAVLAGAVLSADLVVLTQSRGAMVAMAVSLPVFFLISGQRLRGLLALAPISGALLLASPGLNEVFLHRVDIEYIEQALPTVWLSAAGAGLYGVLWGLIDRRWRPPNRITRLVRGVAMAGSIAVLLFGAAVVSERVGNPITWGEQKWEAFKSGGTIEEHEKREQSRYLSISDSVRYTQWQVAWEDFASHPLLGVGTYNYAATYYQLRERDVRYTRTPHSLPLEVLSERGVVGGVLLFGFLCTCIGAGLWNRFKPLDSEGKGQVGAMTAAVTYWFVHSSVDWFWQIPAVTLPVVVYLAMLVGPWQRIEAAPLEWSMRLAGAAAAVLAILYVAPLYAADRYLAQSYSTTDPSEALSATKRAQRFNPLSPEAHEREAILAAQIGDPDRAEEALHEALRLNPEHYAQYQELGQFYEWQGDPEAALSYYREAQALNPLDATLDQRVNELSEVDSG